MIPTITGCEKPDTVPPVIQENQLEVQSEKPSIETIIPNMYTIRGTAFHDYNASGKKDEDEPTVNGMELSFLNIVDSKSYSANTDGVGVYEVKLPEGEYKLTIAKNVQGYNGMPFRYFNESKDVFYPIDSIPNIIVENEDLSYEMGVMQGFLTLPFPKSELGHYRTCHLPTGGRNRWYKPVLY
jgi:hypothetical protein